MKRFRFAAVYFILFLSTLPAQSSLMNYYSIDEFGFTSPGAMGAGLYGYVNPATLTNLNGPDAFITWSNKKGTGSNFDNWGLFAAIPHIGFAAVNSILPGASLTNYKISASLGNSTFSYGLGFAWNSGNVDAFNSANLYTLGTLFRPDEYLSLGLIGNLPSSGRNEGVADLAVRPLGDEFISLFGDYSFKRDRYPDEIKWSAGASVEAVPGLRITGRYFDTKFFSVGIELSLGNFGVSSGTHFDNSGKYSFNTYGIRLGAYDRNLIHDLMPKSNYVELNLKGSLEYQRYKFFDNSNTLLNLIKAIDAAKDDKTISGIAINTSGMNIGGEKLWELREKLLQFKISGKHVVIYFDRMDILSYYLASAADKIVMDPEGLLILQGFIAGRQYYKHTLEKLGIGFTEWRYFKFKSANETFSRDKMSEADSIQFQSLVDNAYQTVKDDICRSRKLSPVKFDDLIDNQALFLPEQAKDAGLVDIIGRWDEVKEAIKQIEGNDKGFVSPGSLEKFNLPKDNYWGEKPVIAVVYAIGICAMDEGISARNLVNDVNAAAEDPDIKAVVLRVDSPGGDGLASDIIAEALIKCKEKKPVIVSQGYLAASGGYWLSMYADTIVASPVTITGSIGVIGGWFYNKSFDSNLGVSTDFVKKGEHADIGFGFTLPVLGLTLPDRDLNPKEQEMVESTIKSTYKEFVTKVAAGRKKSYNYVDSIGQGRIWSGTDGLKNGLVDILGGLSTAINIAVLKAGIQGKDYKIKEYPPQGLIDFNKFLPHPFGFEVQSNKILDDLKFRFEYNGKPLMMLPLKDVELLKD